MIRFIQNANQNLIAGTKCFRRMPEITLLILLMTVLMGCQAAKLKAQDSLKQFSAFLDVRIPELMEKYNIPGVSMAVVHKGRLAWSSAYGYADLQQKRPMTVDAICRVESISKSVTAWGVMRLVEQGLLELDVPAQHYLHSVTLPETSFDWNEVTLRRLLSGTAGLPLGTIGQAAEYPPHSPLPTLWDYLRQEMRLIGKPGAGFMYSNVGFNLLELLVEEVTGRNFADYMAEEVLTPLDMKNSSFAWQQQFLSSLPNGYEVNGKQVAPYVYPARASGGLFATVEDIARFVCAGMTGPHFSNQAVLKAETIRLIYTPQAEIPGLFGWVADHYGLGHFIEMLADGRTAVWHGGQGHGWMTHFHTIPISGDGIVILTNSQRSWPFMAQVLSDWSRWLDITPVKMSRITYAAKVMWMVIGGLVFLSLWQSYRLVAGLIDGTRRFSPLSLKSGVTRWFQLVFSLVVILGLVWCATQPYLFVSSIFPDTASWAGFSLLALSVIHLISAFSMQQSK